MHFQVRTDNHIINGEGLADGIRDEVEAALVPRFGHLVRRAEVYLQDQNAGKGGADDIRCTVELSLSGHQPVAAEDRAANLDEAVTGAIEKVVRVLEHMMGKLEERHGRASMSGEET